MSYLKKKGKKKKKKRKRKKKSFLTDILNEYLIYEI